MIQAEADCDLTMADMSLAVTLCSAAANCFEELYYAVGDNYVFPASLQAVLS